MVDLNWQNKELVNLNYATWRMEKKMNKNEQNVREMCTIKYTNLCKMGMPEERTEKNTKNND